MLLPRYSIRWMLIATAVFGGFCVVLAAAARGDQKWATAITIAVMGALLTFLLYAVFFAVAMVLSLFNGIQRRAPVVHSPFAQHVPAPQLIPPEMEE